MLDECISTIFVTMLKHTSRLQWKKDGKVQAELVNVHRIHAASGAFAAVRRDGRVVTWGDPRGGGDSSAVKKYLGG